MRKAVAALGVLLALAAASPFALAWYASEQILRSGWYEHRTPEQGLRPTRWHDADADPRTELGLDFEDVEFSAIDGSTLRGWFVPAAGPTDAAIVTVHGGGGDRRSYMGLLPTLHFAGYAVLLFDCREQGISDGNARGMSLGMRDAVVGEVVRKVFGEVERAAARLIEHLVDDADQVASDMISSLHGFAQLWLCTGSEDPAQFKDGATRAIAALLESKRRRDAN